jgi:hypothetical protein
MACTCPNSGQRTSNLDARWSRPPLRRMGRGPTGQPRCCRRHALQAQLARGVARWPPTIDSLTRSGTRKLPTGVSAAAPSATASTTPCASSPPSASPSSRPPPSRLLPHLRLRPARRAARRLGPPARHRRDRSPVRLLLRGQRRRDLPREGSPRRRPRARGTAPGGAGTRRDVALLPLPPHAPRANDEAVGRTIEVVGEVVGQATR